MNDWASDLIAALEEYADGVQEGVNEAVTTVGKETAKSLKRTSPKRTGDYRKGWSVKNTSDRATEKVVTVYNRTDYQLTHLLEKGHGGPAPAPAHPHIAAAEAEAAQSLEEKVRIVIGKGK